MTGRGGADAGRGEQRDAPRAATRKEVPRGEVNAFFLSVVFAQLHSTKMCSDRHSCAPLAKTAAPRVGGVIRAWCGRRTERTTSTFFVFFLFGPTSCE